MEHEKRCQEFKSEIDSFKKNDSERFAFYEEKTKTLEGQLSKLNDEKTEILEGLKVQKDNFKKFQEVDYKNLEEALSLNQLENETIRKNIDLYKSENQVK